MSERKHIYLYNPPQKDKQILKAEFVVRTAVFEQIFIDIQEDTMQKPPQHYMLLGQRGMGKTTLLLRLKYAVEDDESLNTWLLPVLFNEEQYAMPDLASFFEHIAQIIAENNPVYGSLLETMRVHEFEDDYEQKAYDILVKALQVNKHKLLVLHDNFGQFLEKIGKISTHRLRNILMNAPEIRLVGASATMLEHTFNYKEPFFDFFYQIRLKGMTATETITLFEKLAENVGENEKFAEILKTEQPRIEVMRKLSGGVIRTMVMLFDVFMDNEKQDSFRDLEAILDRVTPLYKHRMDDLKPQQQLIVDAVARAWDAVTVSEIATLARSERQGLKTNQISAQLKQLVDNQIIEIEPRTVGRTHLYRLQERFFNIWYLMRYSTRQDKQRVIWFVKFLEGWCDTNDLKNLFKKFDNNLEKGTYDLNTVFDRALAYSMVENAEVLEEKSKLIDTTYKYLEDNNYDTKHLALIKEQNILIKHELMIKALLEINNDNIKRLNSINRSFLMKIYEEEFLTEQLNHKKNIYDSRHYLFNHLIWFNITRLMSNYGIGQIIPNQEFDFLSPKLIETVFLVSFYKKQYHASHKFFQTNPELKDRLKPIYYLTMEYLKDEYPNEYLKAGEEMRETIEELKERVMWFEEQLGERTV